MSCKVIFTDTAKSDLLDVARSLAEISKDKAFAVRLSGSCSRRQRAWNSSRNPAPFPETGY